MDWILPQDDPLFRKLSRIFDLVPKFQTDIAFCFEAFTFSVPALKGLAKANGLRKGSGFISYFALMLMVLGLTSSAFGRVTVIIL